MHMQGKQGKAAAADGLARRGSGRDPATRTLMAACLAAFTAGAAVSAVRDGARATGAATTRMMTTAAAPGCPPTSSPHFSFHHSIAGTAAQYAASPRYDEGLMNKWGFHRPACTPGLDFLVANTGMSDRWVCGTEGELSVVAAMRRVLDVECAKKDTAHTNLVLDVGSNSGFYGLMAIAAGCPTVFFDLQPGCNKVVTGALLANGWAERGTVLAAGLSETSGTVKASSAGTCDMESGRFPLNVQEAGTAHEGDVTVPTEPLAAFIGPDTHVLLMKVDTEGFEQRVLAGSMPFFERRLIKHAIVEITPGHKAWETRGIDAADVAATFERIVRAGYSFTLLGSVAEVNAGTGARMTDPTAVKDWVLARGVGQRDVLLSLV